MIGRAKKIAPEVIYETIRRMKIDCTHCQHRWIYSGMPNQSQAEKRVTCPKCKTSLRFDREWRKRQEGGVNKIPKGISATEETKIIDQLQPQDRIRYFIQLAQEADREDQRVYFKGVALAEVEKEIERARTKDSNSDSNLKRNKNVKSK